VLEMMPACLETGRESALLLGFICYKKHSEMCTGQ
jgi:hypothetical protein